MIKQTFVVVIMRPDSDPPITDWELIECLLVDFNLDDFRGVVKVKEVESREEGP